MKTGRGSRFGLGKMNSEMGDDAGRKSPRSDLDVCLETIRRIGLLLRVAKRITPEGLRALCGTHEAFKYREWPLDKMDPAETHTWRRVFFADNTPAKFKHPDEPGERVHVVLHEFGLLDETDLKTPMPTDHASWRNRLQEIFALLPEKVRRQSIGTPEKDLVFLGTVKDAIDKFEEICAGATTVYNTVFTRSRPEFRFIKGVVPRLEEIKNRLLATGNCSWLDIVLTNELPNVLTLRDAMESHLRDKHFYRVLDVELPLFQCLVFTRDGNSGAALVGWVFLGTPEARVYFSEDWETVKYFYDYCHHLYWNIAKDDQSPG
jgi:hypothetical protein